MQGRPSAWTPPSSFFFASSISATIVAEGIETQSELELVRRLKMPYGQGSWLGVPGPFPSVS